MSTQQMSRGAVAAATAVLLGAAFWVGSHSGREASAAPLVSYPITTNPGSTGVPATSPGITVTGTSEVAGKPDTLRLDLSVQTRGDTVAKALDSANSITARVQSSLTRNGVAGKDIQTSDLQVQPEYSYPTNDSPVVKGYTVTEGVTATLRNLGKSGNAISAAVSAGGNAVQVNGISLDLEDNGKLLSTARDRAVANAKTKAEQYAKASGRDLGAVVSISETVSDPPPVAYDVRAMASKDSAAPVPIQPGSENVGVTVTVVYAFR
ncbi:SIMPL domain-containing protein [Pedococcus bigeumensis]|uniref:SIMPL domain-containing protein n=1 Tax=Pedococcus bigeumensis TaxID=433644 RepID=UPI0031DB5840